MLEQGRRVVVSALAESPLDAIERTTSIEPQPPPDLAKLGPRDVVIAIKSAQVGWVDLLMTSGQYQHLPKPQEKDRLWVRILALYKHKPARKTRAKDA